METKDGTRLYYLDGGGGKPVLFVASAWLSSRMWKFQLPYLVGQGLRCVAYDRRGHERSDWPWGGYDYGTLADALATLLEALGIRGRKTAQLCHPTPSCHPDEGRISADRAYVR